MISFSLTDECFEEYESTRPNSEVSKVWHRVNKPKGNMAQSQSPR